MSNQYDSLTVVTPTQVWPFVLHGWFLALVMLLAAITEIGRKYEAADVSATKVPPNSAD